MSYPRKLHILIVEDEQDPIDTYRELLQEWRSEFPSVEPALARSYEDAAELLRGSHPFHLVVLDLNLPLATRQQPPEGIEPGKQLLEMLAQRDDYPVPVVLVVSGRLNLARLSELRDRLEKDFWHGELVNKGPGLAEDFRRGLQKALEYNDVGVHLRDPERAWFPVLSPREHDLLRRCVLSQASCLGVDLEWWGAEDGPTRSHPSPNAGPTKVLMGRFLLDDGMEASRPTFFKFEPVGNAPHSCRDAGILDQKLSHVKVRYAAASRSRSILVTQSVADGVPVSLSAYLDGDLTAVRPTVPDLVADVIDQLGRLGRVSEDQLPLQQLLWPSHRRETIAEAWGRPDIRGIVKGGDPSPLALFDRLRASTTPVWVCRRTCTHGDLNATNIAVESAGTSRPRAFIFDAAGVHADVEVRDLAVLETTTLLFAEGADADRHFPAYRPFYDNALRPPATPDRPELLATVRNTLCLLSAIRDAVARTRHPEVYPLMVFDTVLMQLGGLAVQPSRNKIANPVRACILASWVASWLVHLDPALAVATTAAK